MVKTHSFDPVPCEAFNMRKALAFHDADGCASMRLHHSRGHPQQIWLRRGIHSPPKTIHLRFTSSNNKGSNPKGPQVRHKRKQRRQARKTLSKGKIPVPQAPRSWHVPSIFPRGHDLLSTLAKGSRCWETDAGHQGQTITWRADEG